MIRAAQDGDMEAAYRLMCVLENTALDADAFVHIFAEHVGDPHRRLLVWCDGDGDSDDDDARCAPVQAFLNMRIEPQLHHAAFVAEVQELVVDPNLRGRGVGKLLLAAARQAARDAGCVRLELVTNQRRHDAHRFYEREGMSQSHFGYTFDL